MKQVGVKKYLPNIVLIVFGTMVIVVPIYMNLRTAVEETYWDSLTTGLLSILVGGTLIAFGITQKPKSPEKRWFGKIKKLDDADVLRLHFIVEGEKIRRNL
jgi:hypothetical protein